MDAAYTIKDGTVEVSAPTALAAAQLLNLARYGEKLPDPDAEHVRRLLHGVAPDVEPFPDIAGMTTQIDNAFAGQLAATRKAEVELKECRVALMDQQALAQSMAKRINELEERNEEQRLQLQHLRNATFAGQMKEHLAYAAQQSGGDWIGKGMSTVDAGDVQAAAPPLDTYFGTPASPTHEALRCVREAFGARPFPGADSTPGQRMASELLKPLANDPLNHVHLIGSRISVLFRLPAGVQTCDAVPAARAIIAAAIDYAVGVEREACAKIVQSAAPHCCTSVVRASAAAAIRARAIPARHAAATPTPETPAHA